jgi:hypothetical protein
VPYTPAQRKLFFAQAARGEISKAEAERRAHEGVRRDVDKTGHAKKKRGRKKKSRRLASKRAPKRMVKR